MSTGKLRGSSNQRTSIPSAKTALTRNMKIQARTKLRKLNPTKERKYLKYHQVSLGGTTLHYQGESLRLNENAFRMKSLYGVAVDWPIEYKDLEPYYTETEGILGVAGPEKVPGRPRSKPYPLKPHKLSYASRIIEKACGRQDRPYTELSHTV
jgi:choline dehydrogenase-like flavoprotein